MATDVLDLSALLAPLAEGDGAGTDPREDPSAVSPYRRVKDARSEARLEERDRDSEGEEDAPVAEGWRVVRRTGEEILTNSAKDFEVASWLTEAMVRQDGLNGLITGTKLLMGLLETMWDAGFPLPDEEGIEDRATILGGLSGASGDGTIMQPLRRLPLFRRTDGTNLPLYRYDQAEEVAGRADEEYKQRRYAAGVPEMAVLEAEASLNRPALRGMANLAAEALDIWRKFDALLTEKFSGFGEVPTSRVNTVLQRLHEVSEKLAGGPAPAAATEIAPDGTAVPGAEPGAPGGFALGAFNIGGSIASREAALEALDKIADFFEKTEPHSPLAYTLRDAARRGRMTLPDLLAEVLGDETARVGMLTALGIRPTPPE
ncbi:type VI secretion system protein TssA [Muricoccus radiodurans]|uniref:type VI secretion system protein TssA n=1 Tax=Muricoccus radiodurans TaxID=2231721 RepID=UPI003CF911AF